MRWTIAFGSMLRRIAHPGVRASIRKRQDRAVKTDGPWSACYRSLRSCCVRQPGLFVSPFLHLSSYSLRVEPQHVPRPISHFLIATPIIFGAAVLEVRKMGHQDAGGIHRTGNRIGSTRRRDCLTFGLGIDAVFVSHDSQALNPFAYYCCAFGLTALTLLAFAA